MKEEKLIRFLNNRCSSKENRELMEWLSENGAEDQFIMLLQRKWHSENPGQVDESKQKQMLDKIHKATLKSPKVNKGKQILGLFLKFSKVAATLFLMVFCGYFLYEAFIPKKEEAIVAEVPVPSTKIVKYVAAGEKLSLLLPDKSEVIVNSLSTLSFYSDFGIRNREIELDGEAYFSITPDKDKPFKVKTGRVVTTALGTAFNAYARNNEVKIALTEGKVNVANEAQVLSLNPGEMASIWQENPMILTKFKFDPAKTILWKEGKIQFQSKRFKDILSSLEKWYGVRFEIKAFENRKVTGLFNNESLEDILTGLSFSLGFEYQIDHKNVVIKY